MVNMITTGLLYLIYYSTWILVQVILLLPDVSVDSGLGAVINNITQYLANFNTVLPIATIFQVLGSILVIELGVSVYKIIMWGIRRIPGQS